MSLLMSSAVALVVALLVCGWWPTLAVLWKVRLAAIESNGVVQGGMQASYCLSFSGLGSCSHNRRDIWWARHASKDGTT